MYQVSRYQRLSLSISTYHLNGYIVQIHTLLARNRAKRKAIHGQRLLVRQKINYCKERLTSLLILLAATWRSEVVSQCEEYERSCYDLICVAWKTGTTFISSSSGQSAM